MSGRHALGGVRVADDAQDVDGVRAVSPARRWWSAMPPVALAGLALVGLLLGGTFAWWTATDGFRGGRITAGDLDLTTGDATWEQVTPGVTNPRSGAFDGPPDDFITMPGDVVEISQPVTTTLRGDNLVAGMSVRFASGQVAQDVADGLIDVSFRVEDSTGAQVAPATGQAELGTTVRVPGLTGDDDGVVSDWIVVIRVDVLGDYVWTDGPPTDALGSWTANEVEVALEQLREGPGFASVDAVETGAPR